MTSRRLAVAVLIFAGLYALVTFGWLSVSGRSYQGKTMAEWFAMAAKDQRKLPESGEAFISFGEHGIDFLITRLADQPSFLIRRLPQLGALLNSARRWAGSYVLGSTQSHDCARRLLGYFEDQAAPRLVAAAQKQTLTGSLRVQAVRALGELGPKAAPAAGPALMLALHDPNTEIVFEAITSLGVVQYEPAIAIPRILPFLAHTNDRARVEASYTLGSYAPMAPLTLTPLTKSLTDSNDIVRANAARALGRMGAKAAPALDALYAQLRDKTPIVAGRAAEAIVLVDGWMQQDESLSEFNDALTTLLRQGDDYFRLIALRTHRRLSKETEGFIDVCDRQIDSRSNWHSWEAVETLAEFERTDPRAILALERATKHPNGLVRAKARAALDQR